MQLSRDCHISDELSIIHEVGEVLHLVGGSRKLLFHMGEFVLLNGSDDRFCQWLSVLLLYNGLGEEGGREAGGRERQHRERERGREGEEGERWKGGRERGGRDITKRGRKRMLHLYMHEPHKWTI